MQGPEPSTGVIAQEWIKGLKDPRFNGCGHVRLQLDTATSADYSVTKTGALQTCKAATIGINNANCVSAKEIAEQMIEKYFRLVSMGDGSLHVALSQRGGGPKAKSLHT
jgi:hypothetical protein